jgi:acylpyruvate hydrolase
MRFASIVHDGRPSAAAVVGDRAVPLDGIAELGAGTPSELLRDPPLVEAAAVPLSEVTLRPVIPRPSKIICVGLNYHAHIEETKRDVPEYPVLFTKFASALAGSGDPILLPEESAEVDYEGELAVVIGSSARRVAASDALGVVAGYTLANDVSMRDYQFKTHQWLQGKTWDAATPLGPHLVTPDQVPDPQALELRVTVNGEEVQRATTDLMIFDVATVISVVSTFTTLEPGDVLLTGTPSGVGMAREPKLFLGDGDVVVVEVDGVGRLESVARSERAAQ